MNEQDWQKWFEAIWADREERIYRQFFGDIGNQIAPIPHATFKSIGWEDHDPRFEFHGVFTCPPNETRKHWIYVTSGMSNPWGESPETADPNGYSGLGCEFTLHTREPASWPIEILHWVMSVQLMFATGKLKGELLQRHDRVNMHHPLPVPEKKGDITHLLVCSPEDRGLSAESRPDDPQYTPEFALASGRVELLLLVGITAREADFARTQGTEGLITLLRHRGIFPLTDPGRAGVV